ncbi:tRNA threonylcarbamoyl adenosine modification protein, Sua5/YciO/YrdC/YwlC family [Tangfeifania diversioriginum]|jgi:tRNA threonylcarbamoyl adenosine modification protein (Sua5/YciO/YrdC/YwlC family)|uniref:tRNA threonylcarbamoyl adenosine modification protein, Sua5/YciO/YrdC/YwlC family n=1 Tax=Tangfeifania diversioriginum TaxID=1168035 RepID=A0A1M6L9Y4_9BACT|nr:L-threonylcarbamoyladenylate synthase [Tangfeifania diversioriginum]SHJ67939.1 tRNA threonylcarbamoyl adenosine modification protein, Sua5/YciO/YrdC/YwlC family [Tangfeifania diversioriginum]
MLIRLFNENPNPREVRKVTEVLRDGGIIIYPTDTVYGLGCDITNAKAVEKVARFKGLKIEKSNFSFICSDLSHLSDYSRPISNSVFKLIKKNLPGPFTFILEANNNVPKYFKGKKKTVGIRIPDNNIIRDIIFELGNPILSTSIRDEDEIREYTTDPELIYEKYKDFADLVIDGGPGELTPSTIVDCTSDEIKIVREGKGKLEF